MPKTKTIDLTEIVVYVRERKSWFAESIKDDGSLRLFKDGLAEYRPKMKFKSLDNAIKYTRKHYPERQFMVVKRWPPDPPKIEWPTEVLLSYEDSVTETETKQ